MKWALGGVTVIVVLFALGTASTQAPGPVELAVPTATDASLLSPAATSVPFEAPDDNESMGMRRRVGVVSSGEPPAGERQPKNDSSDAERLLFTGGEDAPPEELLRTGN